MEVGLAILFISLALVLMIIWCGIILSYLAMLSLVLGLLIIWIVMLVDCIQRDFTKPDDKTIWLLVLVLAGWAGALIYYVMVKRPADLVSKSNIAEGVSSSDHRPVTR